MNIKEEMPNYYKILERMENSTHSILDYVIASAFDECTYDELERAAAELARITAERDEMREALKQSNETLKVSGMDDIGGGIAKLIEHNTALLKGGKG